MKFKTNDMVVLKEDYFELKKGTTGTVIHVYGGSNSKWYGVGFDLSGKESVLYAVNEKLLELKSNDKKADSKTKHTPGPWHAVDYAGVISIQNGPMYEDKNILCYDAETWDDHAVSKEEAEANAALITAAPELLSELIQCVKALEAMSSFVATRPIIDRAKAVIEKCSGVNK